MWGETPLSLSLTLSLSIYIYIYLSLSLYPFISLPLSPLPFHNTYYRWDLFYSQKEKVPFTNSKEKRTNKQKLISLHEQMSPT
jgi:hypothetical protein